jgi:hypothetical protein
VNEIEPLGPELEALALQVLAARVKQHVDLTKAEFSSSYNDGDKHTFRSPLDDRKLGQVYRTDPEPRWVISDRKALEDHLRTFPGNLRPVITGDPSEVLGVLLDHAPHLIGDELDPYAVQAALEQSKATGTPAAPGIEKVKSSGALTVKPDAAAAGAIEDLIRAGLLRWDGTRALPERGAA